MVRGLEDFIERLFRLVEMIAVMALIVKICQKSYPSETAIITNLLGWGASYYILASTIGIAIDRIDKIDDSLHHTQKAAGKGFIIVLAFFVLYFFVHPIVVAVADIPFFPGDISTG